jgi:hypothetical protein
VTELTYGQVLAIGLLAIGADLVLGLFIGKFMAVGRGEERQTGRGYSDRRQW